MEKTKILIVEDEGVVALDLKRHLTARGFTITGTASRSQQAIDLAVKDPPDLVLMDIHIKGEINGIDTARQITSRQDTPVIFLTAHSDAATLEQAKSIAPYGYLVKPFEERNLHSTIEMAIYRHRMEKKLKAAETERQELQAQLAHAEKLKAVGTLAGGIAHDFNNLLMGIQGRASLMSMDMAHGDPHREHLTSIIEYVRSAAHLTDQLLGLARSGKYEVTAMDVRELVADSASMFGRTRKQIRIQVTAPPDPLVVEADRRQIEQVLLNLYVNAWQAMPQGGSLRLATSLVRMDRPHAQAHNIEAGNYVKISVSDTGIGMDEATRWRIFDPFFTTKERGRGTGLGLASAYGIINNHKGVITVATEVGQGTTFDIYLPQSQKQAHAETPVAGSIDNGTETILLVDDEQLILDVGREMLEKLGYRVLVADSGQGAVEAVEQNGHAIDLVLLDMIMPGMDGSQTFDRIRALQPDLPVILSSGYSITDKANEVLDKGYTGFIQKPFSVSELSHRLRDILDAGDDSAALS